MLCISLRLNPKIILYNRLLCRAEKLTSHMDSPSSPENIGYGILLLLWHSRWFTTCRLKVSRFSVDLLTQACFKKQLAFISAQKDSANGSDRRAPYNTRGVEKTRVREWLWIVLKDCGGKLYFVPCLSSIHSIFPFWMRK